MKLSNFIIYFLLISLVVVEALYAKDMRCEYITRRGRKVVVDDIRKVPRMYRSGVYCVSLNASSAVSSNGNYNIKSNIKNKANSNQDDEENLALPNEIKLKGKEGNDTVYTSLGNVKIKWSREVKSLLGKNPQRVISNAMSAANRAIRSSSFNQKLGDLNLDWNIVFFGKDIPSKQVPSYLITNCHPGWMVPPNNIYIAVDRVYNGCGSRISRNKGALEQTIGDAELEHVILHEIGHAVEYQLLSKNLLSKNLSNENLSGENLLSENLLSESIRDLKRSEGFATWFSIFSAKYSNKLDSDALLSYYKGLSDEAIRREPKTFVFSGSSYDYARAAMYFCEIEKKRGVSGILKLYEKIRE
ncbi:MAG: hypothetical protein ACOX3T_00195 [Bdellovibrionota bacterium]